MSFTVQSLQSCPRKQLTYQELRGLSVEHRKAVVTHPLPDGEAAVDLHIWRVHLFPEQEIFCSRHQKERGVSS